MKLKEKRQNKILQLIEMYDIQTQEDLTSHLLREGYKTTQATISRDIKEMHLVKSLNSKNEYRYSQPTVTAGDGSALSQKFQALMQTSVIKVTVAQNLVVIKCYPGMAQGTCAAIDSLNDIEVAGTIAGDDTLFVAAYDNEGAYGIYARIEKILGREVF